MKRLVVWVFVLAVLGAAGFGAWMFFDLDRPYKGYADAEQFSVRTSGLPNVGIQGVCFGKTLAAMSPRAEPFNWGNVLWHELAHVFAIQLSKSRVPRWFTEGLSEYETIERRPEWSAKTTRPSTPRSREGASRPSTSSTRPSPTPTTRATS